MLVASAAVGLVAPIAAQASDVINLEEMNSYNRSNKSSYKRLDSNTFVNEVNEDLAITKARVDALEARQDNFEAGSFSDTTTLDGKAIFTLGGVGYSDVDSTASEAVKAAYTYQMNLNTSFTGDDNLYVRIKTGNHNDWSVTKTYGTYLKSGNSNGDTLKVDKIWYEFPVGDNLTAWVGPKIENYYMHGATPSIYKPITKQFTLGGNGEAYGASTDTGAGIAFKADNGFSISTNVGTKSNTSKTTGSPAAYYNTGLLTDETKTSWATQVGYTQPNYSVSALLNVKSNGWSDTYYHTNGHGGTCKSGKVCENFTSVGLRGWWRPDDVGTFVPSISLGFDTTSYENATSSTDNSSAYFVGLNWADMFQPDDKIGFAFGKPTTNEDDAIRAKSTGGGRADQGGDPLAFELYYSYKLNDSVTITPAIFGGIDRTGEKEHNHKGAVLETTFKF